MIGVQISFTSAIKDGDKINIPTGYPGFELPEHLDNGSTIRISNITEGTTAVQVENFLRSITFTLDENSTANDIQFILYNKPIENGVFYFSDTGHYYEYVVFTGSPTFSPPNESWGWITAYNEAQAKTFLGQKGYLATVTSAAENDFLFSVSKGATGWFGGTRAKLSGHNTSDAKIDSGDRDDTNGFWYWACGPEYTSPENSIFYNKVVRGDAGTTGTITYDYAPWSNNEPNNSQNNMNYFYEAFLATIAGSSSWNDTPNFYTHNENKEDMNEKYRAKGYFVEYGDLKSGASKWENDGTMAFDNQTIIANTTYKVEHYQQNNNDDNYILFATEVLEGIVGTEVTAVAKSYTGFTENTSAVGRAASGTIVGNGSLVLRLYYDRNIYTVTFEDWDGTEIKTETVRY